MKRMKKQTRNMTVGLGWCMLAALFLFNPNINIIDMLPDFVGYICLCLGLAKLAELNESVAAARTGFFKMIFVDLAKWPALLWVFGLSVPSERNSSLLLWAFVFAVLEMIFAVPAYLRLFDGMTQLGYFYPNTSLFGTEGRKRSKTDRIKRFTVFFVAAKAALSVLPEFADLTNATYDETSHTVNLYRYIGIMRFLAFLPALIIGMVWLCRFLRYLSSVRKDQTLCRGVLDKYQTEVLPREGLFIRRSFGLVLVLLTVFVALTADLRLEGYNVLPDLLAAGALLAAFLFLQKYTPAKGWLPLWLAYALTAAAEMAAEYSFHSEYTYSAIIRNESVMRSYLVLMAASVIKNIAFVAVFAWLIRILKRSVALHTGYVAGREVESDRERSMIEGLHRELKNGLTLSLIAAVIYGMTDVAYWIFVPEHGIMGLIHLLVTAVCTLLLAKALSAVKHAVDTKYMLS